MQLNIPVRKNKFISVLFFVLILFSSCYHSLPEKKADFIRLEGKQFKRNGNNFYPLILNYGTDLFMKDSVLWVRPTTGYNDTDIIRTRESALHKLKADMLMIKDMGFNTVRIYGIGEYQLKDNLIRKYADNVKDSLLILDGLMLERYFKALADMFQVMDEVDMKVILLTKKQPDFNEAADTHLAKLLWKFKNEKAILAWDFFNEPLYFDKPDRKKEEVYSIVKGWKKFSKTYAPNQLFTIGLTGTREVFEWDPNILDVDFLSIHPYEFHKNEVENEVYWYGKYVKKPWVIGETGFSADGDSVSYTTQKTFAEKFLHRAVNCGASGFSWWQYKDVQWFDFQSNYLGLLNHKGETVTSDKNLVVNGTAKPASSSFKHFDPTQKNGPCNCLDNYYNYEGLNQYAITGKLINGVTGSPIEGGTIVVWPLGFGTSNLTFSKIDGSFMAYGNYKLYHSITSATEMSCSRQEFDWDKIKVTQVKGVPTYDLGIIKLFPLQLN